MTQLGNRRTAIACSGTMIDVADLYRTISRSRLPIVIYTLTITLILMGGAASAAVLIVAGMDAEMGSHRSDR
jgi:hypothetical protein